MKFFQFLPPLLVCVLSANALLGQSAPESTPQAPQNTPEGIEFIQELGGIEEYKLTDNGLRILLMPNEALPVATVMVTYEVGSRNEVTGTTGATHILEHMMFKGTDKFTEKSGNNYSAQMERIGARSNATTYFDRTNYYATLPREFVPLAIELEADRMRGLKITADDIASEMTVVRNEYERGENNPVRTLIKEVYSTAFVAQPYGHPTIGWRSDIENTSPEKLRAFYDMFYWPENAVISVIGGIDRANTLEAIKQFYGPIPKAPNPIPVMDTLEPEQLGPRRLTIERTGQVGVVLIAYKVPEGLHKDWAALSIIQQIAGADKTGRLYRALEDKGKASATFTFAPQLRDPGLFMFAAYLTPDATHEETERIILEEIEHIIATGVTEDELTRAKSVVRAKMVYGRDGPYAIADEINETIAMGDWTQYVTLPQAIEKVSAEDVKAVAAKYFLNRTSTTGWFVPKSKRPDSTVVSSTNFGKNYYRDPEVFKQPFLNQIGPLNTSEDLRGNAAGAKPVVDFSSHMQSATVAGIKVVAIDMPITDVVSFIGSFAAGSTLSPQDAPALASLTAEMLDKGTTKMNRFAIAEQLDTLGAQIGFSASAHSLEFSGRFLRQDAGAVMNLVAKQLRDPAFDSEVFETLKSRQKTWLLKAIDDPDYRADSAVGQMLYPEGHPNFPTPLDTVIEDLESTSIDEVRRFHSEYYGPQSMTLVFAGDIDFAQLKAAVESAFSNWEGGVDYPTEVPNQLVNSNSTERIEITDKTSVSVHYGYNTGLQRTNEDYLHFMVGNYILGASFNSRLMTEVRKKQGLTYNIRSGHEGDILTKGNWTLEASFAPNMVEKGIQSTDTVIQDWFKNGITDDEFNAAIETLSGSYLVGLSTTGRVANQILSFIQRGFEPGYIDQYPMKLREITVEKVNKAIKTYFDPKNTVRAVAGSLEETDKIEESNKANREISIRVDTPDAGWSVKIKNIYLKDDTIIVDARLTRTADMAAQVITTVSDSAMVDVSADAKVLYYVSGKTWDWGSIAKTTFFDDEAKLMKALKGAELIHTPSNK